MNMLFSFEDFTYTDNSTSAMVLNFKENMILMHMGYINIKLIKSDRFVQGYKKLYFKWLWKKICGKILSITTVFNIDNKKFILSGKSA